MHRILPLLVLLAVPVHAEDGPAALGLAKQAGLTLTATLDKEKYGPADDVRLLFALKNETGKDLFVGDGFLAPATHEAGPGRHFEVHVVAGGTDPLYFWSGQLSSCTASGCRRVFRLKPGEAYKGSILLARPNAQPQQERGGSFENRLTRKQHALGKDGQNYTVTLRYEVNPDSFGVWQPPADFNPNLLWTGVLTTKPIRFEVAEK